MELPGRRVMDFRATSLQPSSWPVAATNAKSYDVADAIAETN